MEERKHMLCLRRTSIAVGLAVAIAMTSGCEKKAAGPKRQTAQVVKLIRPPPPPPEQPPPPPPPEKVEEQIPQDTPEPMPDEAPAESLGVDADGSAGTDGFGLAARKGGRDLVGSGGAVFAWYTGMLKDTILETLSEDERVRKGSYAAVVRMWVASDGRVERVKLAQSTGDRARDIAIEETLTKLSRVREAPPIEMPQPITLRIVSRG